MSVESSRAEVISAISSLIDARIEMAALDDRVLDFPSPHNRAERNRIQEAKDNMENRTSELNDAFKNYERAVREEVSGM